MCWWGRGTPVHSPVSPANGIGYRSLVNVFRHFLALPVLFLLGGIASSSVMERMEPHPLADLPEYVTFTKGAFGVFVDFDHPDEEGEISIFLINDTTEPVALPSQDGDVYLKQEAQVDGEWVRSEPHESSWCNLSYYLETPIPPGHWAIRPAGPDPRFWGRYLRPADSAAAIERPVRYRFYFGAHTKVVSNEGVLPVPPKFLQMAAYDAMVRPGLSMETFAAIATGKIDPGFQNWYARDAAVSSLAQRFPGEALTRETLRTVIAGHYHLTPDELKRSYSYSHRIAIEALPEVFGFDEALRTYKSLINDPLYPFAEEVLGSAVYTQPMGDPQTIALLDEILGSFEHRLYVPALRLRAYFWKEDERRSKFMAVYQDPVAPEDIRVAVESELMERFPNSRIRLFEETTKDSGFREIRLENISDAPITLTYAHPYDLLEIRVRKGEDGVILPFRDDFPALVASERHAVRNRTLAPGESFTIEAGKLKQRIQRTHRVPDDFYGHLKVRVVSKLPQFGKVPAGFDTGVTFEDTRDPFAPHPKE